MCPIAALLVAALAEFLERAASGGGPVLVAVVGLHHTRVRAGVPWSGALGAGVYSPAEPTRGR